MSWSQAAIGEHVQQIVSWNPAKSDSVDPFSYIDLSSIDKEKKQISLDRTPTILPAEAPSRARQYVEAGDILVATVRPNLNGVAKVPASLDGATASTGYCVLRANGETLCPEYLYYWVQNTVFVMDMVSKATGANYPAVSDRIIKDSELPLPPIEEQKRIAATLDKADNLRRKRQQAIQLADEFLRAVFLDMFGDPKLNPKFWKKVNLGELIQSGPTNGLYKPAKEYGKGTRIIRIDGFYDGKLEPEAKLKRVQATDSEIEQYRVEERNIIINRVNSPQYLGKCAFVEALTEPTIYESNMMNFSVDERFLNSRFLVQLLQSKYLRDQIRSCSKDSVNQSSINQQDVKSLQLIVPDIDVQNKFEAICLQVQKVNEMYGAFEDESIFESISQKAFSGEL